MAAVGKLYSVLGMGQTIVLGVELEEPVYKHYEDNEMPGFYAKFPYGWIPPFVGTDGFNLTEGAVIIPYSTTVLVFVMLRENISTVTLSTDSSISDATILVAESPIVASISPNSGLLGGTAEDAALVDQHVHLAETEIQTSLQYSYMMINGYIPYNKGHWLSTLKTILLTRTYLAGERLTHVDIADATYTLPAKEKQEKELRQPAPVLVPKKEKPKKAEEDDEEDENPNPKTPLISYQNRRSISWTGNALIPTRTRGGLVALSSLSTRRVDPIFMSSNQTGGFFNCLEASHKYLPRSMGVLGVANDSIIAGVLILQGQDVKSVVKVAPKYRSYDYKKLDLENSEDKAFWLVYAGY
ncbi:elongation factor 1-gamma [Pisolithus croceorrhizus]|nr:elongation factor 1-gamma [Pisolithus croceorrhizus]